MGSKFTPGPWWVGGAHNTQVLANIPDYVSTWIVAECRIPERVLGGIETFPSAANARLISTAPDLLSTCIRLLAVLEEPGVMDVDEWKAWKKREADIARELIRKATTP